MMIANRGDDLPVSALPVDGTFPTGTTQYEKRSIAQDIPIWDPKICIQCGLCSLVCPHATIRMKVFDPAALAGKPRPASSRADYKGKEYPGWKLTRPGRPRRLHRLRPVRRRLPGQDKEEVKHKAIDMEPKLDHLEARAGELRLLPRRSPTSTARRSRPTRSRARSCLLPLFEFSGACAGCGETPYVKLHHAVLRRPDADRQRHGLLVDLRRQPALHALHGEQARGKGPTWSNSLFEDGAEFGFGFRLAVDQQRPTPASCLRRLAAAAGRRAGRGRSSSRTQETTRRSPRSGPGWPTLEQKLAEHRRARRQGLLLASADYLIRKSVWSFGGDGWAYDIGFGGLDHVFASGRDVNILVLDTEVYSNTGGQASKSTPRGAVAKFAAGGKPGGKKDLGMIAMSYGNVFVGQIRDGRQPAAHAQDDPRGRVVPRHVAVDRLLHCIGWGIDMSTAMSHQKEAVACGYWPLYRFDPRGHDGSKPFQLDSRKPTRRSRNSP